MIENKARSLKYRLQAEIRKDGGPPHRKLPSDAQLAERFGVNRITIRKALNELVRDGVIYRVERKGTFVAPAVRMGQVLIVTPYWWDSGLTDLFRGIVDEVGEGDESVFPALISPKDFLKNLADIDLVFRDLAFVIFFRELPPFQAGRDVLLKKDIPFCFYGSDIHLPQLDGVNRFLYRETDITTLAFDRLALRSPSTWAGFYGQVPFVSVRRFEVFRSLVEGRGERVEEENVFLFPWYSALLSMTKEGPDSKDPKRKEITAWIERIAKRNAAVFTPIDRYAMGILRIAHQMGIAVPRDFTLASVDNAEVAELSTTLLTSVRIPIYEDGRALFRRMLAWSRERGPAFETFSRPELIVRESS